MCEFIAGYEDIKLLKKRTNKLTEEEEEEEPELEKPVEQSLLASK